jgi:nicotinamidase-related amidase
MTVSRFVAGTRPYPWPYDGRWSGMALLIVACQQWWVERAGDATATLESVSALRAAARSAGLLTLFTVHSGQPRNNRPSYLPPTGTAHAAFALAPDDDDVVVPAAGLDACYGGPLEPVLRSAGIDRVLIAGPGLEGPVHSTMRSLNDQGYECLLVADACGSDGETTRGGAVGSVLMSGGIFGAVGDTAAVVAALSRPYEVEQ